MRCIRVVFCVFSVLCATTLAQSNAIPFVNLALSPVSVAPGSGEFTLTVTGTGFAPTAVLNWNRSPRLTEVISNTLLRATINASDVAKASTGWITVTNPAPGGGTSNVVFLPVREPSSAVAFVGVQAFNTSTVAVGDFNNDGNLDVVWFGGINGTLNVSLGNGNGTFQAPIANTAAPFQVQQIITGDFNGDGYLDVAVYQVPGHVFFYLGNGTGTLTLAGEVETSLEDGQYINAADFNNNGTLDLYVTGWNAGSQWFDIGSWQYNEQLTNGFSQAAIGDFTGEGYLDLANPGVFLNNGAGAFQPFGSPEGYGGYGSIAADMNHDGKLDLVDNGCIALGNGDGTFSLAGCGAYYWPTLGVGDFNGDRNLDAALDDNGRTAILLGTGDGTFSKSFLFPGGSGSETYLGAIGDFNNDGMLDVITGNGFLLLQTTASLSPTSFTFGNQNVGTSTAPQTATLSNLGNSALVINAIRLAGTGSTNFAQTDDCGSSLAAGASCTITVTFAPKAGGTFLPWVNVSYKGAVGSPQKIALVGTGVTPPKVTLLPAKLKFATQLVGTSSSPQTATLTNTGDQSVAISSISITGAVSQTNNCPSSLGVGGSCQIQIVFRPSAGGTASGKLTVNDNAQHNVQTVGLSGAGTAIVFSPESVNFGDQKVGTKSAAVPVTVTNIGPTAVSISGIAITGTNPGDFTETNNCGNSIARSRSCTINVTFVPAATGARSGLLSVSIGGGGDPPGVPLDGTGT